MVLFVGAQLTRAFSLSHTLTIHLHTSPQNNNVGILNIENIATRNGEKQEQQLQQLPQEKMANWKKMACNFSNETNHLNAIYAICTMLLCSQMTRIAFAVALYNRSSAIHTRIY